MLIFSNILLYYYQFFFFLLEITAPNITDQNQEKIEKVKKHVEIEMEEPHKKEFEEEVRKGEEVIISLSCCVKTGENDI